MEKIKKTKTLLALLLLAALHAGAQPEAYQWQAPLLGLKGEGYYRLLLSPDVRARAAADGADLRIVDRAGDYVPYLLRSEAPGSKNHERMFLSFSKIANQKTETIIIYNPDSRPLSQLEIDMRNTVQSVPVVLSGSDDGLTWFNIDRDLVLSPSRNEPADTFFFSQSVNFPVVKYKMLRLEAKVSGALPVNLNSVTVLWPKEESVLSSEIPAPVVSQRDSDKKSYISLEYKEAYTINRLGMQLSGAKLFHRQIHLYTRDTSSQWTEAATRFLSSFGANEFSIQTRSRHLMIVIDNEDNKPLHLDSVWAFQLNTYLSCYLDADRNYFIVFGNPKALKPNYDIAYFEDSIRNNVLKEISCGPISANTIIPSTEPVKKATAKGLNKWWIWPVLIAILALLLFFTYRVSRDINRKP